MLPKILGFLIAAVAFQGSNGSSNIVMFLTDDQDLVLNGLEPMPKTRKWFEDGQNFENAFVSTPVCCPSRSSLLTGRYQHNTNVVNNSRLGNCYGDEWISGLEARSTFASIIKEETNYETFYAGKYLNEYRGTAVPKGWDHWYGLVGNSKYYNYTLNVNGVLEDHGDSYENDYLTDIIGRHALEFLSNHDGERPFLMVLATPASHAPFTPAPQYSEEFPDEVSPRLPHFNHVEEDNQAKHWFVTRQPRPLNSTYINQVDEVFRNRWRTLLSVDDLVDNIFNKLSETELLDNTVALYTSDHGYHLGNYGLPLDKRMPYDTDIRVPLMFRGSGIVSKVEQKATAVITLDIAPTMLAITGLNHLDYNMDGISLLPYLQTQDASMTYRDFLIEYHGEGGVHYGNFNLCKESVNDDLKNLAICEWEWGCKCQDSTNNTYSCLRVLEEKVADQLFCWFQDDVKSEEFYDLINDPYQLHNLAYEEDKERWIDGDMKQALLYRMEELSNCHGPNDCNAPIFGPSKRLSIPSKKKIKELKNNS